MRMTMWALAFGILLGTLGACGGGGGGGGVTPAPATTTVNIATFQRAALVLGQASPMFGQSNGGLGVGAGATAWSYVNPERVDGLDGGPLYVVDSTFDRVLGYDSLPAADGAAASFVLGQSLLFGSTPGTAADKLNTPIKSLVAAGRLFVVDFGNNRVVIWNALPTGNTPADVVVGQGDFLSSGSGIGATQMNEPTAIAATDSVMVVADGGNARILVFNQIPSANGQAAVGVLGQPDFATTTPGTTAAKVSINPSGLWTDGQRLVVADTVNNRVLIWSTFPTVSGTPADIVVGQPDFVTSTALPASARDLNLPQGVFGTDTQLFVADTNNNRVLVFEPFPTSSYPTATKVLGQSNFTNDAENDDDQNGIPSAAFTSDRVMNDPTDVTAIGNRLFVTDQSNHRVLVFEGQ